MKGLLLRFSCLLLLSISTYTLCGQQVVQFVSGDDGQPLIGVTAIAKLSDYQAISDGDGLITIPNALIPINVECSYLGYTTLSLEINQLSNEITQLVLEPNANLLNSVEIIGRSQERRELLPQRIEVISQAQIQASQSNSSADVIGNSGSVYVQKSQAGGGSPVIRGFEANKVLLVVDGVRLNNLIYRSGHLQNAITVDHSSLANLELIFGPGSLMYGSDALGGVIHFETLRPQYNTSQTVSLNTQFTSSNLGARLNLIHQYGSDKLASVTSLSIGRYDDQRVGQNRASIYDAFPTFGLTDLYYDTDGNLRKNLRPHIQRNTGYSQADILQKFKFKLGKSAHLTFNAQLSTSTNIPRYDQLAQTDESGLPIFRKWYYGPQQRLLLSQQLDLTESTPLYDKAILIASFQEIEESRITQPQSSDATITQLEQVRVYGLTTDFMKTFNTRLNLNYGLDLHHNTLNSSAESVLDSGERHPALTRYPDGLSNLTQYGAYIRLGSYLLDEQLRLTGGVRYSGQLAEIRYESMETFKWPDFFYDGISNRNSALVASGSVIYQIGDLSFKYAIGQGFRAPNIDDLAKVRVKSDEITIPNTDLRPERTLNHDLSVKYSNDAIVLTAFGYYVVIDEVIVRKASTLPDGSPLFIDENGRSLNVTANFNESEGLIYGGGMALDFKITHSLSGGAKVNLTKGISREGAQESPLGHIPPLFGWAGVKYDKGLYQLAIDYHFNGSKSIQDYGGTVDNPEYALPTGTPAWSTVDIGLSRQSDMLTLRAAVDNVLDTYYRPFASGVSGPGRSFNVSVGLTF